MRSRKENTPMKKPPLSRRDFLKLSWASLWGLILAACKITTDETPIATPAQTATNTATSTPTNTPAPSETPTPPHTPTEEIQKTLEVTGTPVAIVNYENQTCDIFLSNDENILTVNLDLCVPEIHQDSGIWGRIYDMQGNIIPLKKPEAPLDIINIQAIPVFAANDQGVFLLGKGIQEGEKEFFLVKMSDGNYYFVLPAIVIEPVPTVAPSENKNNSESDGGSGGGGGGEIGGKNGY